MSDQNPTPTPLAKLLDEHWQEIVAIGCTPIWRAENAETAELWRQQIRARARREGVRIRTSMREVKGQFVGCAYVPEQSQAQIDASGTRRHHHGLARPER